MTLKSEFFFFFLSIWEVRRQADRERSSYSLVHSRNACHGPRLRPRLLAGHSVPMRISHADGGNSAVWAITITSQGFIGKEQSHVLNAKLQNEFLNDKTKCPAHVSDLYMNYNLNTKLPQILLPQIISKKRPIIILMIFVQCFWCIMDYIWNFNAKQLVLSDC